MTNVSLTSRIVGAIVLLSLGIIFIPVLLETNKIDAGSMDQSPIPVIPNDISTIVFQLNDETGKFEEQGASPVAEFERTVRAEIENSGDEIEYPALDIAPVVAQLDSKKPQIREKLADNKPTEKPNMLKHTWMLQVASFKDYKKAVKLRDELRAKQYVTHINERKHSASTVWRVRIGPDFKKSNIQKIQQELVADMGLKGLIVRRR